MCGIAGIVNRDSIPVDERALRNMLGDLAHRGPDGEGVFSDGAVALGHRRLAIIDLVSGQQPMSNADGSVTVVFNGEIYNFRELRKQLEARGLRFRTTSDTEVLLRAYESQGVACLGQLRGMFAFAIWDARKRQLVLARDRVGIKPLVYAWDGRRLLFASELKALLRDPSVPRELDQAALQDYLTFDYVPSPRTIFSGIHKLPPACYLVFNLDGGEPLVHRYWDLRFRTESGLPVADWCEALRWHLRDAVRSQMVSDVPIGAFLSGGVDSSTVVALMAQSGLGRVRTFAIGFESAAFDEAAYARRVAERYGTEHHELVVKPDAIEAWTHLDWHFDEPFADSSALPTYFVSKITRQHVTVALSGDGGDENFAGYLRYARAQTLHERWDSLPGSLAKPFLRLGRLLPAGIRGRAYAALLGADPITRYFRMMAHTSRESTWRLLTSDARNALGPDTGATLFHNLARDGGAPDYVSTLQYLDVRTYLPEDILTKVDRTSMSVSLECRVPLLDHVLMELMATMPMSLKLSGAGGKAILKRAMAHDLPAEILHRPKQGFAVPLADWLRKELAEHARDLLLGRRTRERGLLDSRALVRLLDEHLGGRRDHARQIWALMCLEAWARRWWDR